MPLVERSSEITRSTWCWRKASVATVRVMAPGRVPAGGTAQMLVSVEWSTRVEGFRVEIRFRQGEPAAGDVRFGAADGEAAMGFDASRDRFELLEIHGAAASSGAIPDVILEVAIGEDTFEAGRMSVGDVSTSIEIQAVGGAPAPASIRPDEELSLAAVVAPEADGELTWLSLQPEALTLRTEERVAIVAEGGEAATGAKVVGVLFRPASGGADAVAFHRIARRGELELEQEFVEGRLRFEHLEEVEFRRRLEGMSAADLETLLAAAGDDERITTYLTELLAWVRPQRALQDAAAGGRRSVAFLMGSDPDSFYVGAAAFYELNPADEIEDGLRDLRAVRDYLENNAPANGRPWGDIDIVVHANEEGLMTIPVVPVPAGADPESRFANPENLRRAVNDGDFDALADGIVDAGTRLRIRGCALGQSQPMVELLGRAFGGDEPQRPQITAPRHLQAYEWSPAGWRPGDPGPASAEDFYVEFFHVGFPSGERPAPAMLVTLFQRAYPGVPIDWADALTRTGPPAGNQTSSQERTRRASFDLAIEYLPLPANAAQLQALVAQEIPGATDVMETGRRPAGGGRIAIEFSHRVGTTDFAGSEIEFGPRVPTNDAERLALVSAEPDFVAELARGGRVFADFTWAFNQNDVAAVAPRRTLTLEARGTRTVVRVERELREPDPANPGSTRRLRPPLTDLRHFGEDIPVRPQQPTGNRVLPRGVTP